MAYANRNTQSCSIPKLRMHAYIHEMNSRKLRKMPSLQSGFTITVSDRDPYQTLNCEWASVQLPMQKGKMYQLMRDCSLSKSRL